MSRVDAEVVEMILTVKPAYDGDNYKDTIRIHSSYRHGLKSGRLGRVSVVGGENTIVAVRGLDNQDREIIRIDLETRRRLQVSLDKPYDFTLKRIWPWQAVLWACRSSDPALRVATWIAVLSFVLGLVGIGISIIPFVSKH
jgi:hypothetical protein